MSEPSMVFVSAREREALAAALGLRIGDSRDVADASQTVHRLREESLPQEGEWVSPWLILGAQGAAIPHGAHALQSARLAAASGVSAADRPIVRAVLDRALEAIVPGAGGGEGEGGTAVQPRGVPSVPLLERSRAADPARTRSLEERPATDRSFSPRVGPTRSAPAVPGAASPPVVSHEHDDPNVLVRQALVLLGVGVISLVCSLLLVGVVMGPSLGRSSAPPEFAGIDAPAPAGGADGPHSSVDTASPSAAPGDPLRDRSAADAPGSAPAPAAIVRDLRDAAARARSDAPAASDAMRRAATQMSLWWPAFDAGQRSAATESIIEFIFTVSSATPGAVDAGAAPQGDPALATPPFRPAAELVERLASTAESLASRNSLNADEQSAAVWAAGVLTRFCRETDAPGGVVLRAQQALTQVFGTLRPGSGNATFAGGAAAALRIVPTVWFRARGSAHPAATAESVDRWLNAVAGLSSDPAERFDGAEAILAALDAVIRTAPEPDSDRAVFDTIATLTLRCSWRADAPARLRLLGWFSDPGVSAADLSVITQTLATRSGAEGVTSTMVLAASGSSAQRNRIREAYAAAWSGAGAAATTTPAVRSDPTTVADAAQRWAASAAALTALSPTDPLDQIVLVTRLAALHEAAELRYRGDAARSAAVVSDVESKVEAILAATPLRGGLATGDTAQSVLRPNSPTPGQWAITFIEAQQSIPQRLQALDQAAQTGTVFDAVDAEVLIEAAFFATPGEVRRDAQRAAGMRANDPVIVNAVLEYLPRAPRAASIAELIARVARRSLPDVSDPSWPVAARRAVVERLLEVLGSSGVSGATDSFAALIEASYAGVAGYTASAAAHANPHAPASGGQSRSGAGGQGPGRTDAGGSPTEPIRPSHEAWTRSVAAAQESVRVRAAGAGPLAAELERVRGRHAGRVVLAVGPVQRFAADQLGVAESLAVRVIAEEPAAENAARRILAVLDAERVSSDHVFAQLLAAERAIVRLWMARGNSGGLLDLSSPRAQAPASSAGAGDSRDRPPGPGGTGSRTVDLTVIHVDAIADRLASLDGTHPDDYFRLAEEAGAEADTPAARRLARTLYIHAMLAERRAAADSRSLAPSVCLGLAHLATRESERRWLRAMAAASRTVGVGAMDEKGGAVSPGERGAEPGTALRVCEALGFARAGEGRRTLSILQEPGAMAVLERYEGLLSDAGLRGESNAVIRRAREWTTCPECFGRRFVTRNTNNTVHTGACYTCAANPGPALSDAEMKRQLRFEAALLSGVHHSWSAQSICDQGEPLRDLDPLSLPSWYAVDPAAYLWRDGSWTAP